MHRLVILAQELEMVHSDGCLRVPRARAALQKSTTLLHRSRRGVRKAVAKGNRVIVRWEGRGIRDGARRGLMKLIVYGAKILGHRAAILQVHAIWRISAQSKLCYGSVFMCIATRFALSFGQYILHSSPILQF